MYSDHFVTQLHGLVRFAVFILSTEPNRNIRKMLIELCHINQYSYKLLKIDIFFLLLSFFFVFYFKNIFMSYLKFYRMIKS